MHTQTHTQHTYDINKHLYTSGLIMNFSIAPCGFKLRYCGALILQPKKVLKSMPYSISHMVTLLTVLDGLVILDMSSGILFQEDLQSSGKSLQTQQIIPKK